MKYFAKPIEVYAIFFTREISNGKRAHGIIFHHFHDEQKHIVGQGAVSAEQFDNLLSFYEKHMILFLMRN